jgi:transcriptional regulator with XRE-family HTH domain
MDTLALVGAILKGVFYVFFIKRIIMNSIGERLAVERKRMGLDQEEFGALGGVKRNAQLAYEKNRRPVNSDYLERLGAAGVDLFYIMTGDRLEDQPPPDPTMFEELVTHCIDVLYEVQNELGIELDPDGYKQAIGFAFTTRATKDQVMRFVKMALEITKSK